MTISPRPSAVRRLATLVVVNVIVFAVLAESAGLFASYVRHGGLYYLERPPLPPAVHITDERLLTADMLHPYFGPLHKPGVRPATNNVGFDWPQAYPSARANARQFLVGIFGGSVGFYFCRRGAPALVERLKSASPFFAGRDIVPLCFSHEGYKQPQQMLVLAYFLSVGQAFDMVINIDGFNEVALGSMNQERGRDISMPSPLHIDELVGLIDRSTLTPEQVLLMADIVRERRALVDRRARLGTSWSAALDYLRQESYAYHFAEYNATLARIAQMTAPGSGDQPKPAAMSVIGLTPPLAPRTADTLYADIAREWMEASRVMHDTLAARGIPYIHVLQPNQYWTTRPFSPAEDRIAHNAGSPFKKPVEAGYPVLVDAAAKTGLASKEPFLDATGLFDREPAQVYEDDCCHYTVRGNELLARFIADRILETPGPWKR